MTNYFYLDWPILAVSSFNTILLLWLGLVVLLNAERRTPGIWLTGASLLTGAAFFVSHTALVGLGFAALSAALDVWWQLGWLPVLVLPLGWYLVTLWYSGFWAGPARALAARHTRRLVLALSSALLTAGLLFFANPLPSFSQALQLDLSPVLSIAGLPALIVVYPVYSFVCIAFSLDALMHPGPTARLMGDLARRRARPWLVATNLVLLLVTLLVAGAMLWFVLDASRLPLRREAAPGAVFLPLGLFDLAIASLIAAATFCVGQAIVVYEVFTGKTLPRRGLARQWRQAVALSAGFSFVVGWSVAWHLPPVYTALLTALIVAVFYSLLSWRSYVERERYIHGLRPFVASQRLYDQLLARPPADLPEADLKAPFQALCENVLGAKSACLIAVGPLSSLAGPALVYPARTSPPAMPLTELAARLDSPQTMGLPLDPARYSGAQWAVSLWSERGLIGFLVLGEKVDGGLYAQEEIEIARASGERFLDTLASAGLAQKLVTLQRQRLAENQILDHRTRRRLHDEVLPRLHAAMLPLNDGQAETLNLLSEAHRQIADLLRELPPAAPQIARLGLVGALRQLVADEFEAAFDAVAWEMDSEAERRAQSLPAVAAEVLFYAAREALRNAARYARPAEAADGVRLRLAVAWDSGLKIVVEDDGVGAVTQPPTQGSGQGLALHSAMLAVVGGALTIDSQPGAFTRVSLTLPHTAP